MMRILRLLVLTGASLVFILFSSDVFAAGQSNQFTIRKLVLDPDTNQFVSNLNLSNHRFISGEAIAYKIQVRNIGTTKIDKITVTDNLPGVLTLVSGQTNYQINNLGAGQTDEKQIIASVSGRFNTDQNQNCVVNTVSADTGESTDNASSQICVERSTITQLPSTGPETGLFLITAAAILGFGGIIMVKKGQANAY